MCPINNVPLDKKIDHPSINCIISPLGGSGHKRGLPLFTTIQNTITALFIGYDHNDISYTGHLWEIMFESIIDTTFWEMFWHFLLRHLWCHAMHQSTVVNLIAIYIYILAGWRHHFPLGNFADCSPDTYRPRFQGGPKSSTKYISKSSAPPHLDL